MRINNLITIEGVPGVGKTITGRHLFNLFQKDNVPVKFFGNFQPIERESLLTKAVRRLLEQDMFLRVGWERETALLIAQLLESIEEDINPALNTGNIVIYECYYDAIVAYQSARLREYKKYQQYSEEKLLNYTENIVSPFFKDIPVQRYTILLTCSQDILRERLVKRDQKTYSEMDENLSKRIYNMYHAKLEGRNNCIIIDTVGLDKDKGLFALIESIYNKIKGDFKNE